ncbi:TRAP transporter small permease [Peptoniphilus sp. SGI.035]|uniref:TRAP transporter small permease n=1 Tax=unclassified Peptoniphilus TaxID=2637196 RepID=UPI002A7ED3FF|nr:TRAP transporter small permease [Peptoniphilus sp.]MDY3903061.1 TRAP transporter small permease [Peptoniphilus sp.]
MLNKLDKKFEESILCVLLVIMTIILGIQIVARYVFGNSLAWSEELVRYLFVWSAFLGVPYCIRRKASIKVDQFRRMMPVGVQKAFNYIDKIIIFVLFLIIALFSFDVIRSTYISGQTSAAMGIPMWIVQSSVFVGSVLSMIRITQNFIDLIKGRDSFEEEKQEA